MKIKLPCGRFLEAPLEILLPGLSKEMVIHTLIEDMCLSECEYAPTCGFFHDWFVKNHRMFHS